MKEEKVLRGKKVARRNVANFVKLISCSKSFMCVLRKVGYTVKKVTCNSFLIVFEEVKIYSNQFSTTIFARKKPCLVSP